MLALILLVTSLADVARPDLEGLSLKVTTTRQTVLVGEPTTVVVTWAVSRPTDVGISQVRLFIDDGRSVREWNETALAIAQEIEMATRLEPGRPRKTSHVVAVSGVPTFSGSDLTTERLAFAFPKPGVYKIGAEYDGVRSPWHALRVVAPTGVDAEVFERYIKPQAHILTSYFVLIDESVLRDLFRRYPRSPYLEGTKRMFFARQQQEREATSPAPRSTSRSPRRGTCRSR